MMTIKESISILQKPESIWSFWIDVSNDVQWRNGITQAEWTSPPPFKIGSTGKHIHKDVGVMEWEITRFEDGSSFEFIHTAGALKGSIAFFEVKPEIKGSLVHVQMKISGPIFLRIMLLFMGGRMRKGVRGDLQKLKELMETRV
jgi:hypothetical protein